MPHKLYSGDNYEGQNNGVDKICTFFASLNNLRNEFIITSNHSGTRFH